METVVRVVEPPFAVLVDEFTLAFQEVGVVLVFPSHAGAVVGEGAVVGIPIGDDAAVGSERTQIHDRNRADAILLAQVAGLAAIVSIGLVVFFGLVLATGVLNLRSVAGTTRNRAA